MTDIIRILRRIAFGLLITHSAVVLANGLSYTALDEYVNTADENYAYTVADTVAGPGYRTLIIEMTSQQWLTETEVNDPIWQHYMTVTIPDTVNSNIAFLYITGGSKSNSLPETAPESDITRALRTQTVVSTLYMVPNQPLRFTDSPDIGRTEDAIIAYTWDKYFRTGDEKWPLRLPMTKSAVRAMDTITSVVSSTSENALTVDKFVVAGGSKRGWTTWTTAIVDPRVIAIAPIVIDMLNISDSFKHHYSVYGAYSLAVIDYVTSGVVNWIDTPEWDELMDMVEPYEYRDRLTLPKYILNSTGDEFFLPDSWQFYWDDLVGEKHLRYVPNSNHSMRDTDVIDSLDSWYHSVVYNVPLPRYSWRVSDTGTITLFSLDEPTKVLLWQATNESERNFTQAKIGRAYSSSEIRATAPGVYEIQMEQPESGYVAYYLEAEYESGIAGVPFKFSSGTKVLPDTYEYEWRKATEETRSRNP